MLILNHLVPDRASAFDPSHRPLQNNTDFLRQPFHCQVRYSTITDDYILSIRVLTSPYAKMPTTSTMAATITKRELDQSLRLKKVLEKEGFYWTDGYPVTDNKRRDARIMIALSYYIKEDTQAGQSYTAATFRALQVELFDRLRVAVAQDDTSPAWATPEVMDGSGPDGDKDDEPAGRDAQGKVDNILSRARKNIPWGHALREGDFISFITAMLLGRDFWYLYEYKENDPAESAAQMARRGVVAIAIDRFLDVCNEKENAFASVYPRKIDTNRVNEVASQPSQLDMNDKADEDDSYVEKLFEGENFEVDDNMMMDLD